MVENNAKSGAIWTQQLWDGYEDACKRFDRRVAAECNWRFILTRFNAFTGLNFTEGELRDTLRMGDLPPSLLYVICRSADLSVWDEAQRLGLLPDNLEDWLNARNHVSSAAAVDAYLRAKDRDPRQFAGWLGERVQDDLKKLVPGVGVSIHPMDRGFEERQPYHSYLVLRDERESTRRQEIDRDHIRSVVEATLTNISVNAHWEHSPACKPEGYELDDALILETFFDNRPSRAEPIVRGPVVILGPYYSGAKDVAVLIARETGLGALDCSRYIAEKVRDSDRFRHDNGLMAATFWSAVQGDQAANLCITIDDAAALTESPSIGSPRARLRAKVFLLTLSARALMYAAYRVEYGNRSRVEDRVAHEKVQAKYKELVLLQQRLDSLAHSTFSEVKTLTVDFGVPQNDQDSYPDAVDALFDVYVATAQRIVRLIT